MATNHSAEENNPEGGWYWCGKWFYVARGIDGSERLIPSRSRKKEFMNQYWFRGISGDALLPSHLNYWMQKRGECYQWIKILGKNIRIYRAGIVLPRAVPSDWSLCVNMHRARYSVTHTHTHTIQGTLYFLDKGRVQHLRSLCHITAVKWSVSGSFPI